MTPPLKIAFITDGIFPHAIGGMQRHSRLLIEELAKEEDLHLSVVHPHVGVQVFETNPRLEEHAIPDINWDKNYLKECHQYSKRVYEKIRHWEFDVLYAQGISVWHKAGEFKDRLVINPHGLEPFQTITTKDYLKTIPFRKVERKLFRTARYVATEGGHLTGILQKIIPQDKIIFLPNAVNLPQHKPFTNEPIHVPPLKLLFVARFAKNKGIHVLLEAVKALNENGYQDQIMFNLAGKGPLWEHYKTNFAYPNVNYLGFVPDEDLFELYRTNDAFVFPTLFEGMPTVILEAMSNGLPVVASDVGGIPELVNDENGSLIPKNNAVALEKAIIKLYEMPDAKRQELGARSKEKVAKGFTWPILAQKHKQLFDTIKKVNSSNLKPQS